jgi:hypothetical protein
MSLPEFFPWGGAKLAFSLNKYTIRWTMEVLIYGQTCWPIKVVDYDLGGVGTTRFQ